MTDFQDQIGRTSCRLLDMLGLAPLSCLNDRDIVGLITVAIVIALVVVVAWRRFL